MLERRFLRALVAADLPKLAKQHELSIGSKRSRLDFAYPDAKLGIE